jgi:hypothetical protein
MKYQNYAKFLIPITINPSEFGNVIEQIGNKNITPFLLKRNFSTSTITLDNSKMKKSKN